MVATKVSEVFSKGYEWASGGPAAAADPGTPRRSGAAGQDIPATPFAASTNPSSSAFSSPSALWDAASTSLSTAADQAYSTLAGVANSAWTFDGGEGPRNNHDRALMQQQGAGGHHDEGEHSSWLQTVANRESQFSFGSPWKLHNPYNRVRGRYAQNHYNSSLSAVRSLLPLVTENGDLHDNEESHYPDIAEISESQDEAEMTRTESESSAQQPLLQEQDAEGFAPSPPARRGLSCPYTPDPLALSDRPIPPNNSLNPATTTRTSRMHKNSETASQLAEGTVRALRDIALDEAVELNFALRFWSDRWEHPLLSWLEAGPTVWGSRHGYNHQLIGQKVAQIQAILARRCSAIGELQQHLLRAGWQRGVAQWGVLGQGGQWATVQGTYVMTEDTAAVAAASQRQVASPSGRPYNERNLSESLESMSALPARPMERIGMVDQHHQRKGSAKRNKRADRKTWNREKGYYASVFVRNENDGKIHMDDVALAEWSVDAMALIRNILERASNGKVTLPYEDHWKPVGTNGLHSRQPTLGVMSDSSQRGELILEEQRAEEPKERQVEDPEHQRQLPVWAKWASKQALGNSIEVELAEDASPSLTDEDHVVISNLPIMAAEVSELLNSIEDIMNSQRHRRLRKLRPPSTVRRRWYLTVVAAPVGTYLIRHLAKGYGSELIKVTMSKLYKFFQEHVYVPFVAIIEEVWRGRENMSDKKARVEVIAGLKEMIRSWLEENHPEIPAEERMSMAEVMDISLIEQQKAESMKSFFELNQAVRLSFIEMQFIKKEMVNALYTMDEMMSANEINMNLAAVTPAVLLLYSAKQVFKFFYYALLRIGKSREETYASFRQILTDIERLLVMRDNPPTSPFPHHQLRQLAGDTEDGSQSQFMPSEMASPRPRCDVLSPDDLGMLMLHIHECRTILWRDYSRFSPGIIQSVSEDLAELAGERGAVSVQQQLQIIARMVRTYPFLKVISIGTTFHERFIGS